MESMLSMTSAKMTSLDLGDAPSSPSEEDRSSSVEEMLTTPKCIPDSSSGGGGGNIVSPRGFLLLKPNWNEDMLTTPVLNTPNNLWSSSSLVRDQQQYFEPENLSSTVVTAAKSVADVTQVDIGLRSPCDGLLAKRRKQFKTQQGASDSNSCDTPNSSQNSPRDLTMRSSSSSKVTAIAEEPPSPVRVKLELEEAVTETRSASARQPTTHDFKHPSSGSNLPPYYTPSPLAVPSPNWSAVERIFAQDMLKTPMQLDSNVFDFLTPPPITPCSTSRGNKQGGFGGRDCSPGCNESDRYSGRDQRLSPRLSPRFPIPEAPTDLSGKEPTDPPPFPDTAEDLSTSRPLASVSPVLSLVKTEQLSSSPPLPPAVTTYPSGIPYQGMYSRLLPLFQSSPDIPFSYPESKLRLQQSSSGSRWPPAAPDEDEDESMSPVASGPNPPPDYDDRRRVRSLTPPTPPRPSVTAMERRRRGRTAAAASSTAMAAGNNAKKRSKGKKDTTASAAAAKNDTGPKRVYSCPHCQRSYDWNYNLNRHLKYECGKENAFQCAKCGRKFPHKQNCVYHLKRKHKVVCDSIDQYMAAGLVLFRGSANPSGQQVAKPAAATTPQNNALLLSKEQCSSSSRR